MGRKSLFEQRSFLHKILLGLGALKSISKRLAKKKPKFNDFPIV